MIQRIEGRDQIDYMLYILLLRALLC